MPAALFRAAEILDMAIRIERLETLVRAYDPCISCATHVIRI